jgi:hypothetical protein
LKSALIRRIRENPWFIFPISIWLDSEFPVPHHKPLDLFIGHHQDSAQFILTHYQKNYNDSGTSLVNKAPPQVYLGDMGGAEKGVY